MAFLQKHGGSPASSRQVVVVVSMNWLFLSASEFVCGRPGTEWSNVTFISLKADSNCGALSEYAMVTFLFPMNCLNARMTLARSTDLDGYAPIIPV